MSFAGTVSAGECRQPLSGTFEFVTWENICIVFNFSKCILMVQGPTTNLLYISFLSDQIHEYHGIMTC